MPHMTVRDLVVPLTGDGTADGYVTVSTANAAKLYPGTVANLYSAGAGSLEVVITDVDDGSGKVGVRALPQTRAEGSGPNYGRTPVTAYTVLGSASLQISTQIVPVEGKYERKPLL